MKITWGQTWWGWRYRISDISVDSIYHFLIIISSFSNYSSIFTLETDTPALSLCHRVSKSSPNLWPDNVDGAWKYYVMTRPFSTFSAAVMVATAQTSADFFFLENIVTMCQGNWSNPRRKGTSRVNLLTSVITVASSHSTNHGLVNDFLTII